MIKMPKPLGLKKTQSSSTTNQKSITQFFTTVQNSQNGSPEKGNSVDPKTDSKLIKRKAISPVKNHKEQYNDNEVKPNKKCKISNSPEKNNYSQNNENVGISQKKLTKKKHNNVLCEDGGSISDKLLLFSLTPNSVKHATNNVGQNSKNSYNQLSSPVNELNAENLYHDNNLNNNIGNNKKNSPKKSPKEKATNGKPFLDPILSPSKYGSTFKGIEIIQDDVDDIFAEDHWDLDTIEESKEDLNLSVMQRCEIISVIRHPLKLELKLKNDKNNIGTCYVEGVWLNTPLQPGEIVSVLATHSSSGKFTVNTASGLITLRPDHLISTTSVVAGVFCKRKAVLQERWRGIDSANTAMTIGILVHELVQKALTQNLKTISELGSEVDKILKDSIQMLYDAGITETEARSDMQIYIGPLAEFMTTYMAGQDNVKIPLKGKWNGKIDKVLDIEENLCCPTLGLKGKIDATLQVTIHDRGNHSTVFPLELKSGRATMSAEHRGQVFLYGMMLSLQRQEDPTTALQRGLLLYLKERIDLKEVSCGYPERRDLIMLRNELVQHLASGREEVDTEKLVDIEDASRTLQQSLPEPVHHHSACGKCPYLTICSLHLWHTDGPRVSESNPLVKLKDYALGHLSPQHIQYFLHWTTLVRLEEKAQMTTSPLHALWTDSVEKRSKRGVCAANLKLKTVTAAGDRFLHVFVRRKANSSNESKYTKGPQEGEFSIVSLENRPWIAAGVVTVSNNNELHILLERDLSRRFNKLTVYHIDTYESYATAVQNLTNLGVLMEDSDRALRLRKLIIDKETAQFAPKLPREVGRLGAKLMRSLNQQQVRAVLRALAAQTHALLRGLPGTGKTQTISVLIQMLVALKKRVLVTAHTHSAVDTVLNRLPESLRVMRLGSASRVSARLQARCEHNLIRDCRSTEQLTQLYDSMEVVGVTCLGANHPMLAKTTFDVCIVDEATQVLQCTVLRPLFAAERLVLVGDPEQLPPVVKSRTAKRLGMEESLFHRLMNDKATFTLQLQYRMNQPLVDVANKVAYNNSLICADQKVAQAKLKIDFKKVSTKYSDVPWLVTSCSPEFDDAAIFLNIEQEIVDKSEDKSLTNTEEACIVMAVIETLKEGGVSAGDIGVIAPYRDQVSLLRRCLTGQDVEVSTVDQFQGRDKNIIIYSCTKRNTQDPKNIKEGEILNDQRRLAVSVTRAKYKFIIIGDLRVLRRYAPLLQLTQACKTVTVNKESVLIMKRKFESIIQ